MRESRLRAQLTSVLDWDNSTLDSVISTIAAATDRKKVEELSGEYFGNNGRVTRIVNQYMGERFDDRNVREAIYLGENIKTTVKRSSLRQNISRTLDRKVVNCLHCGKIFDCRQISNAGCKQFLASDGVCTFCGHRVKLTFSDGSSNISAGEDEIASTSHAPPEGLAAAAELRDRLVEYDRQFTKRTTVIDDQGDYFAINSNAWLTSEEREALKRQEVERNAAEEAHKRRRTVTIDLLGRKIIVDEIGEEISPGMAESNAELTSMALSATTREKPFGGGAAVASSSSMPRITVCPTMGAVKYVYVPRSKDRQPAVAKNVLPRNNGSTQRSPHSSQHRHERIQHDDVFQLAAAEIAELLAT